MAGAHLKGGRELALLAVLAPGPAHGYAVIGALRGRSNGEFDLPEGTQAEAHLRDAADAVISWAANPADANRTFLPPGFYGNGNYQDGQGWALLDKSAAICNGARLAPADGGTNTNGVVAGESLNTTAQPCR